MKGFVRRSRRGVAEHRIDRWVANVRHGRFERSLVGTRPLCRGGTTAEIYLEHYRASFGNKVMWSPIMVTPPVMIAGIGGVFSRTLGEDVAADHGVIYTLNGLVGEYYHARGVARRPGGSARPATTSRWARRSWLPA